MARVARRAALPGAAMSPRTRVGYEGEGRARRPIYRDDVIEGTPHGIPVGSPEAAAAIARVGGGAARALEIQRNDDLFPGRPALGSEAHLQQSRVKGAKRHVEVVAATRPAPSKEEPAVSEEPTNRSTNIPADIPGAEPEPQPTWEPVERVELHDALNLLEHAARDAGEAWVAKLAAADAAIAADEAWRAASQSLNDAWQLVEVGAGLDRISEILSASPAEVRHERLLEELRPVSRLADVAEDLQREEARASVELDEHPDAAHTVKPSGPKAGRASNGLSPHQQRVIEATLRLRGDRKAVARELGMKYVESVDGALEYAGRKGQLPVELIPLLPARFAKYATVPA